MKRVDVKIFYILPKGFKNQSIIYSTAKKYFNEERTFLSHDLFT
jgi:hypothetical protein